MKHFANTLTLVKTGVVNRGKLNDLICYTEFQFDSFPMSIQNEQFTALIYIILINDMSLFRLLGGLKELFEIL